MKMTPKELRQYIDGVRMEYLQLKKAIEIAEFEFENTECQDCKRNLATDLEVMNHLNANMRKLPQSLINLEEYLAEDEMLNGWKGEDRTIDV